MKLEWILMAALGTLGVSAADWPQWRGPHRTGVSAEKLNGVWAANGPETLWQAAVGTGFASVAVSHDRVYTMGNTNNQDTVWCFDAKTGAPLWRHTYAAQLGPQWYEGGPGATPTVDAGHVYTISKWGDVFCFDAASGAVVWQRDLRRDGVKPNRWGFAGSPLIWGDLVILNAGTAGIALSRADGHLVWSNGTNAAGYASPVRFTHAGQDAVLIFAAKHLVALEPKSGQELWRELWETAWDTNNTDPEVQRDRIFVSSFSRGCGLLSVQGGKPQWVYTNGVLHSHLSPGVVQGEYLYAFNGEAKQDTDFRCLHLPTGDLKWAVKDPPFGSLILADDKLVILSHKGELVLAQASPAEFKPLARAKVLNGVCWSPPALANGQIYVRNAKGDLRCLRLTSGTAEPQVRRE